MQKNNFSLSEIAKLTQARLQGNPDHVISSVADLETADTADLSFLSNPKYLPLLATTKAGAICVSSSQPLVEGKNYLISEDPSTTFQQILKLFKETQIASGFSAIHPTAVVHEQAFIGENVTIGPYVVVDQGAVIQQGTILRPFVYVGAGVQIGENCLLHAHSVVREYCILGHRVILQPGAVIGSCGFGYTTTEKGQHIKLEQLGNVVLEDDVEIGANTTIDRARFKTTTIKKGTKIDNLVQIAHNVEIGEGNILAAQTGIAGSTKTGRNVFMGGQVGVVGHLEITDFVAIAAQSGIGKSIKEKGTYGGSPAVSIMEYHRTQIHQRRFEQYVDRIAKLEQKIASLESCLLNVK